MSGPFSVVDAWSYSMTYAGREGNKNLNIPNDPGLSEGQAAPVYSLLDQAFVTTFPGLDALTRTEMAECTKQLFYKTFAVLGKRDTANPLKEKDLLLKFSEEVVRLLEPAKVI